MANSSWEDFLELQIEEAGLPKPVREYRFLTTRRFRFDFAWPNHLFAVEVDGNVYGHSRHTSGTGFSKDCEKFALAAIEGYRVIRITSGQVNKGDGIGWIKEYFKRQVENKIGQ